MVAIALTVAVPVISRVLPMRGAPGMEACDRHDGHREAPAAPGAPIALKCGYCDLLGHSPVLLAVGSPPVLLPLPPAGAAVVMPAPRRAVREVLAAAPRGPPAPLQA
ncbi:DUF2946 family protein [Fulvimonas yonginensis]|uniref:DUF2946 family protein n=1 Tax=Fulvimonas yonginensis TaxID=1495200 RepID=A0ABU8J7F3_9GAMM